MVIRDLIFNKHSDVLIGIAWVIFWVIISCVFVLLHFFTFEFPEIWIAKAVRVICKIIWGLSVLMVICTMIIVEELRKYINEELS